MSYNTIGIIKGGEKKKLPVVMVSPKVDGPDYVEVTCDGVKTIATMLNELYEACDTSRVSYKSFIVVINEDETEKPCYIYSTYASGLYLFNRTRVNGSNVTSESIHLKQNASKYFMSTGTSVSEYSSSTRNNGVKFRLYYDSATLDLTTLAKNSVFDPTGTSLSSTNAEDAIKEVDENTLPPFADGTMSLNVDIINTTSSAPYETPRDGFLFIGKGTGSAVFTCLPDDQCIWTDEGQQYKTHFIPKGVKIYCQSKSGNAAARFRA